MLVETDFQSVVCPGFVDAYGIWSNGFACNSNSRSLTPFCCEHKNLTKFCCLRKRGDFARVFEELAIKKLMFNESLRRGVANKDTHGSLHTESTGESNKRLAIATGVVLFTIVSVLVLVATVSLSKCFRRRPRKPNFYVQNPQMYEESGSFIFKRMLAGNHPGVARNPKKISKRVSSVAKPQDEDGGWEDGTVETLDSCEGTLMLTEPKRLSTFNTQPEVSSQRYGNIYISPCNSTRADGEVDSQVVWLPQETSLSLSHPQRQVHVV